MKKYASVIEERMDDEYCTMESVLADNTEILRQAKLHDVNYMLIDDDYEQTIDTALFGE